MGGNTADAVRVIERTLPYFEKVLVIEAVFIPINAAVYLKALRKVRLRKVIKTRIW